MRECNNGAMQVLLILGYKSEEAHTVSFLCDELGMLRVVWQA